MAELITYKVIDSKEQWVGDFDIESKLSRSDRWQTAWTVTACRLPDLLHQSIFGQCELGAGADTFDAFLDNLVRRMNNKLVTGFQDLTVRRTRFQFGTSTR